MISAAPISHYPLRRPNRYGDELLAHSILLEERSAPVLLRWAAVAILALIAAFVAWAAHAPLAELVRAEGEVETTLPVQRVQHLEGGIVAEILVRDGQTVEAGDLLLRLDTRALETERGQLLVRRYGLNLDLTRLEALLADIEPDVAAVPGASAAMIAAQHALYKGQRTADASRRAVLESEIATTRAEIDLHERLLTEASARLGMIDEERAMRRSLAATGVHTRVQVIEVDLRHSAAKSEVRRLEGELRRLARVVAETEQRLVDAQAEARASYLAQRSLVLRELGELDEAIDRLDDRLARSSITAPVSGVVTVTFAETVGGVLTAGADAARILPAGADLRVRARIDPRDVGWVAAEDPIRLRFPAFDFAELPPLEGHVVQVLPGVAADSTGRVQFTAFVALDDTDVLARRGLRLMPGMAAQVDIRAGERTLLDYLIRPLKHLRAHLFTER
ncbi:MAG: HlyD family type I secretion periplasmic adaptor subunit [Geminicoccaceae bacterium]|nr:MAG: HlyD family type I secretion periplasmic adaptor subunit [Geminicoccaceae bacterium]